MHRHITFLSENYNIPPGRHRCRLKDNIKTDLKEIWCGLDSAGSGYSPVAGFCEYGNETSGSMKVREFIDCLSNISFSRKILLHVDNGNCVSK
jgi:hypothetical protein